MKSLLLVLSWARNPGSSSSNLNIPSTVRTHVLPLLQRSRDTVELNIHCHLITDHYSGPGRVIGPACVSVCFFRTVTFELNDLWSRYLSSWPYLGSISKVRVTGWITFFFQLRMHITTWCISAGCRVLKWSVRRGVWIVKYLLLSVSYVLLDIK